MAHKTIHICDYCESYVLDERDVWPINIRISVPAARNRYLSDDLDPDIAIHIFDTDAPAHREICTACAKKITKDLLLLTPDTSQELFKDFKPPDEALTRQIQSYTDDDEPNDP